ncbi:MAPEG family protein [Thalassotalea sp. 1_MG-2023]|uniref:MAPEG family protein n=1 Tax=Thalassotalea sp. 1_MG-2023 TaxID=3062680 RepID=UPI0034A4EEA2
MNKKRLVQTKFNLERSTDPSIGIESNVATVFAWLFVILRIVHAFIHLTYNHIIHRMLTFWAAFICVMVLWVNLLIQQT